MSRSACRLILACLTPAVLSGCTLFLYALVPDIFTENYERDESIFVFPAVPQFNDSDYSFPVTGNAACEGIIRYVYIPNKPLALFRERDPLEPPPDNGILASGIFQSYRLSDDNGNLIYIPAKFNQSNGWPEIYWTRYEYGYEWEGEIAAGTAQKAKLDLYVYAGDNRGIMRKAVLKSAKAPHEERGIFRKTVKAILAVSEGAEAPTVEREIPPEAVSERVKAPAVEMVFHNYISEVHGVPEIPPYYWGKFISSGAEYKLYAVVEDNYYARYPNFTQRERSKIGGARRVVISLAEFFLKKGQKFQLVDKSGAVVAEVYGDEYTLYDTLPESEWEGMKHNIGMFYVYRLIVRALFATTSITEKVYF